MMGAVSLAGANVEADEIEVLELPVCETKAAKVPMPAASRTRAIK
jgi:hypothetical protein